MAASAEDLLHLNSANMGEIKWKPLSLTLVEYPEGDLIGQLLALISLTPFAIMAGFVALILFRRDLHTITFFVGLGLSDILNLIIKHFIREPRPIARQTVYQEYGMPSTHSQFMWFFASYTTLFICIRLHHMNNNSFLESLWKGLTICVVNTFALVVCISRVYLQYHTWSQVLGGALIGIILGGLWFTAVCFILSPCFPTIASWKISEILLLRDTTLIPNVLWFEYTNIRQETRARSRKLVSMKSQ